MTFVAGGHLFLFDPGAERPFERLVIGIETLDRRFTVSEVPHGVTTP